MKGTIIFADCGDLPAAGSNITLSCPPGLVLSGPSTSICMENGEWEPHPSEVECEG